MDFKIPLKYKISSPKSETIHPKLFFLIHGYGANEEDLYGLREDLPKDAYVISFRAPNNLSFGSYHWYQIHFDAKQGKLFDVEEVDLSIELLNRSITEIKRALQIPAKNIFWLGFSQGAILGYSFMMRYPNKINHLIALSGYWEDKIITIMPRESDVIDHHYFISHGEADPVIPFSLSHIAKDRLNELSANYVYKTYRYSGHNISMDNFRDLLEWIDLKIN